MPRRDALRKHLFQDEAALAAAAAGGSHTQGRLGEQLGTGRLGGAPQGARRMAADLEGALSLLATATPHGERSIRRAGPSGPVRIGACRDAILQRQPSGRRRVDGRCN